MTRADAGRLVPGLSVFPPSFPTDSVSFPSPPFRLPFTSPHSRALECSAVALVVSLPCDVYPRWITCRCRVHVRECAIFEMKFKQHAGRPAARRRRGKGKGQALRAGVWNLFDKCIIVGRVPAARLILARRKLLRGATRAGIYGILHVSEVAKLAARCSARGFGIRLVGDAAN